MKRIFDFLTSFFLIIIFLPLFFLISIIVKFSSKGPIIYYSKRFGKDNNFFYMPKFRTMFNNSPDLATHLIENPERYITPVGKFLRSFSLDELPQLFSVLKGEMSLVGPRPALFNQDDLIHLRVQNGIDKLKPGISGWAQVNGRDDLAIETKIKYEVEYNSRKSLFFDLYILILTVYKVLFRKGINH